MKNIDEILQKHFLNKDSKEELEIINQWKQESEENLEAYRSLESHLDQFDQLNEYKQYNTENAWDKLNKQLEQSPSQNDVGGNYIYLGFLKYAAVFIALIAAIYLLKPKEVNQASTIIASTDEIITKTLADNSIISLNHNTQIDINGFLETHRELSLDNGEAYFEIESDIQHPFVIKMGRKSIEVTGTAFNVNRNGDEIRLNVVEGSVRFSNGSRFISVYAGEQLYADKASFSKSRANDINNLAWKTKELVFNNKILSEAVKDLSKFYNTTIRISPQSAEAGNCILNTKFSNESLDEMLIELERVFKMEYQQTDHLIVITKTDC